MGNQQGVSAEDSAWLAGMLNGDGCFSLFLRKVNKRWKCDVSITLTQTDPCVINRASKILIDVGCNPSIVEYPPARPGNKTRFNMRISKMAHINKLLSLVLPKMCGVKQAKGELLHRFVTRRLNKMGEYTKINFFDKDIESLNLAKEFYKVNEREIPKEVAKALRDYPQGVEPSGSKRTALKNSEDIVQSCLKGQAPYGVVSA